jgi:hypothetical protein
LLSGIANNVEFIAGTAIPERPASALAGYPLCEMPEFSSAEFPAVLDKGLV